MDSHSASPSSSSAMKRLGGQFCILSGGCKTLMHWLGAGMKDTHLRTRPQSQHKENTNPPAQSDLYPPYLVEDGEDNDQLHQRLDVDVARVAQALPELRPEARPWPRGRRGRAVGVDHKLHNGRPLALAVGRGGLLPLPKDRHLHGGGSAGRGRGLMRSPRVHLRVIGCWWNSRLSGQQNT